MGALEAWLVAPEAWLEAPEALLEGEDGQTVRRTDGQDKIPLLYRKSLPLGAAAKKKAIDPISRDTPGSS